jgi:hypothetical protein
MPDLRSTTPSSDLGDDILDGAAAIAAFLGTNKRRAFYLCENKLIPAFKFGNKWTARKSGLHAYVDRLEAASMPDTAA